MIIFPDVEVILVTRFRETLDALSTPIAANVRVATKFAQPDEVTPPKQIIINAAYNGETTDRVTKLASVTIDVYADNYGTATQLALMAEAISRTVTVDGIKRSTVRLGPVRTTEDTTLERRSIDLELIVKGSEA